MLFSQFADKEEKQQLVISYYLFSEASPYFQPSTKQAMIKYGQRPVSIAGAIKVKVLKLQVIL